MSKRLTAQVAAASVSFMRDASAFGALRGGTHFTRRASRRRGRALIAPYSAPLSTVRTAPLLDQYRETIRGGLAMAQIAINDAPTSTGLPMTKAPVAPVVCARVRIRVCLMGWRVRLSRGEVGCGTPRIDLGRVKGRRSQSRARAGWCTLRANGLRRRDARPVFEASRCSYPGGTGSTAGLSTARSVHRVC